MMDDETQQPAEEAQPDSVPDETLMEAEDSAAEDNIETVQGEVVEEFGEEEELIDEEAPAQAQPGAIIRAHAEPSPPRSDRVEEVLSEAVRQKSGSRLAIFPLAMGFIGLGALLLIEDRVEGVKVTSSAAVVILAGALVLTYLFRFFLSGRRERGLFFLALITIGWGALIALVSLEEESFTYEEFWPLALATVGMALFITFLFERSHQVGLVFPGFILLFASGVAFAVSLEVIDQKVLDIVADYWPLVLAFIGLTLFPSAVQRRS